MGNSFGEVNSGRLPRGTILGEGRFEASKCVKY